MEDTWLNTLVKGFVSSWRKLRENRKLKNTHRLFSGKLHSRVRDGAEEGKAVLLYLKMGQRDEKEAQGDLPYLPLFFPSGPWRLCT